MAICDFDGNADMYGLGIRLGYYLQWYGALFASLLAPKEVEGARFSLALFVSATFLALIIQTIKQKLYIIEIYVIPLLAFGAYVSLVPLLLWRLVTGCNPLMDPSRFPLVDAGSTHSDLHALLLLAVTGFQLWFWIAKIPELDGLDCSRYGFLFARVRLNGLAFQVANIILYSLIGLSVLILCALRINSLLNDPTGVRHLMDWEKRRRAYVKKIGWWPLIARIRKLRLLNLFNNLVTASIIVIATELTIRWNRIGGVNEITSAGQLIPFVIGLGGILRVLYYIWLQGTPSIAISDDRMHPTSAHRVNVSYLGEELGEADMQENHRSRRRRRAHSRK